VRHVAHPLSVDMSPSRMPRSRHERSSVESSAPTRTSGRASGEPVVCQNQTSPRARQPDIKDIG
jgi:hypothetical protein